MYESEGVARRCHMKNHKYFQQVNGASQAKNEHMRHKRTTYDSGHPKDPALAPLHHTLGMAQMTPCITE